jgi:hypothetical protein
MVEWCRLVKHVFDHSTPRPPAPPSSSPPSASASCSALRQQKISISPGIWQKYNLSPTHQSINKGTKEMLVLMLMRLVDCIGTPHCDHHRIGRLAEILSEERDSRLSYSIETSLTIPAAFLCLFLYKNNQ